MSVMMLFLYVLVFFFFNDTATTEIYTLSLHDALPISTAAGPLAFYVRAEYQHAPSAPAPSAAIVNFISGADLAPISMVSTGPVGPVDRPRLLDAYATVNINNWQLVLGKQSLSWAPGSHSMTWTNNIEPVDMVRLVNPEPFRLPGFLSHLGPVRIDQFFGRLVGHPYVPRPFVYGQKVNVKLFSFLELGFGRRTMIGGTGGETLNASTLFHSLLGLKSTRVPDKGVPGDNESEMDWTIYVPKVRNYVVLY